MTITCPKCETEVSSEATFCRNCGVQLISALDKTRTITCPKCGTDNDMPDIPDPRMNYLCSKCRTILIRADAHAHRQYINNLGKSTSAKRYKSLKLRLSLVIAAVACGLAVHVIGMIVDKFIFIGDPDFSGGVIAILSIPLGFVVMGVLIYKWVR